MNWKVVNTKIHIPSIILIAAALVSTYSCDSKAPNPQSEPRKSVLIGSVQTSGPDAALIAEFNELLISKFEDLSAWNVVLLPQFDYNLVGESREQEMHRLGLRFFLATRVSANSDGNVYITAQLTDAWTEKNIWTHRISGPESTIESLALDIARLTHNTLGEP